jgi:hypothetical protein
MRNRRVTPVTSAPTQIISSGNGVKGENASAYLDAVCAEVEKFGVSLSRPPQGRLPDTCHFEHVF